MMFDINILLSFETSERARLDAATSIINTYELPLTQEEIMKVFVRARNCIRLWNFYLKKHLFLFDTLLNNNKGMFVAIAKLLFDGNLFNRHSFVNLVVGEYPNYNIGYVCPGSNTLSQYKRLLDFYDFDVDNLAIDKETKLEIQQYKLEKYGGKLTKVAT